MGKNKNVLSQKMKTTIINSLVLMFLAHFPGFAAASDLEIEDKTESPYFEVGGSNGSVESFPLLSTEVNAQISGVIANVEVRQVYQNRGHEVIEAVYVFPGSTRAAIHGMEMKIGERLIKAQVQEKESARRAYQEARNAHKTASLLEQKRPNVFQMEVANIHPGDRIEVRLSYTEHLVPEDKIYEFTYPAVVAPRYSHELGLGQPPAEEWISNPYLVPQSKATADQPTVAPAAAPTFDLTVTVAAGLPVQDLRCDTHKTQPEFAAADRVRLTMLGDKTQTGNRDYILHYRLADQKINTGLLLHQGGEGKENFFLLTVQPPARTQKNDILPREYVFVVDISGSMNGFPLNTAKALMRNLVGSLRDVDRFNILAFASGQHLFSSESVPGTQTNLERALHWMESCQGGGGTEMVSALQKALALPSAGEETSRIMLVITDGLVSFEREAFDLIRNNLGNTNLFAFGIGSSVNRYLIEGIGLAGQGESFIVTDSGKAASEAKRFRDYVSAPLLRQVTATFEGFDVYDVTPQSIPDVFADRPVTIHGKWKGNPGGRVIVRGRSADGPVELIEMIEATSAAQEKALPYLWARQKIRELDDFQGGEATPQAREAIVKLGLDYNLMSRYTSFVAIDNEPRAPQTNTSSPARRVAQPLPMPQGINGGTTPGPGIIPLILAGLSAMLGKKFLRKKVAA
jgi:Ca-activated chloride channel homolog